MLPVLFTSDVTIAIRIILLWSLMWSRSWHLSLEIYNVSTCFSNVSVAMYLDLNMSCRSNLGIISEHFWPSVLSCTDSCTTLVLIFTLMIIFEKYLIKSFALDIIVLCFLHARLSRPVRYCHHNVHPSIRVGVCHTLSWATCAVAKPWSLSFHCRFSYYRI